VKVTVAVLAAGAAMTACGPLKTGSAAIVGHDRITVAKLDSAVTEWGKELPKYPAAQQIVQQSQSQDQGGQPIPFDPASPQRSALHQLLDMRAWDEVARERKITISPGQVDSFVASNGGWPAVDANILAQGLPTRYGDEFARTVMTQQALIQAITGGAQVDQTQQQQVIGQVAAAYTKANHTLGIDVNPRYGTFDERQVTLGPVCPELSSPDSGTGGTPNEVKCQD
jgi:hypothetical protein